ncbi:MAG: 5-formyltetrahydrofolate cyclo-ligase [Cyanobacteria bacterium P01_A01_bin.114]
MTSYSSASNKGKLRQEIWATLKAQNAVKRDPVGHIPNFIGAEAAAERLATHPVWQQAQVIKCNPDSPHKTVRLNALKAGKLLYMAVPRLSRKKCFVQLSAADLEARNIPLSDAANMRGAMIHGRLVAFYEMQSIDLVVVGCVAASASGGRTGKGAGYADLELAMLSEFGLVQPDTPIVTTVHSLQVVPAEQLPMQTHDWALDYIVTPEKIVPTNHRYPKPQGIDWDSLQPEQIKKIPILRQLRAQHSAQNGIVDS